MSDEAKSCKDTLRRCLEIANVVRQERSTTWRKRPSHNYLRDQAIGAQKVIDAIQREFGNAAQS